jgi:Protein of unknown function (DUF1579)
MRFKTAFVSCAALSAAMLVTSAWAEEPKTDAKTAAPPGADDKEMMAKMMELAKPGENHKLLGEMAGNWTYKIKFWMAPDAPPSEASGTATRKEIFGGRYYQMNVKGMMDMPGENGKMKKMEYQGMSLEAYDNVKQKFTSTYIDNMGTGIMLSEGTYDPNSKSFTFNAEMEPVPGMKTKVREVITVADKDHHKFEWFENRGGQEVKTMEINYTRKK